MRVALTMLVLVLAACGGAVEGVPSDDASEPVSTPPDAGACSRRARGEVYTIIDEGSLLPEQGLIVTSRCECETDRIVDGRCEYRNAQPLHVTVSGGSVHVDGLEGWSCDGYGLPPSGGLLRVSAVCEAQ